MQFISKKDSPRVSQAMEYISQLDGNKDWSITIKLYKKNLTASQRNYYHDLIGIISEFCGEDKDSLKTRMCFTLGYTRIITLKDGREVEQRLSTEKLTREEYSKMIEAAQMACMQLGLQFPEKQQYDIR